MADCIFCKIAKKEMASTLLFEDDLLMAFADIQPQAPFHILIVPKAHIASAAILTEDDGTLLGRVYALAARLTQQAGYTGGYRVVTNVGAEGGQSVPHLHFHVLAGRMLEWPPG